MPRPLHAYARLREEERPADVLPAALAAPHETINRMRPPSPLVSFTLARVPPTARFARQLGGVVRPKTHKDLVGVELPWRLRYWEPRFRQGAWPDSIARELYDRGLEHITPVHFCMGCFPHLEPKGSHAPDMTEYPGVPELFVWAYGLELDPLELRLAHRGMDALLHDPLFLIWAADPDPDYIPRSFAPGTSPLARLRMFARLQANPLSIPWAHRSRFLNLEHATPEKLLELPRRPRWTLRSSNLSLDPALRALQVATDTQLS